MNLLPPVFNQMRRLPLARFCESERKVRAIAMGTDDADIARDIEQPRDQLAVGAVHDGIGE